MDSEKSANVTLNIDNKLNNYSNSFVVKEEFDVDEDSDDSSYGKNSNFEENPFKCLFCYESFKTPISLEEHENWHKSMKNFICKICQKLFKTAASLKRHDLLHQNAGLKNCTSCSKYFTNKQKLIEHQEICFLNEKQEPVLLDIAENIKKETRPYQVGLKNSDGIEYFKCEFCPTVFYSQLSIRDHMELHARPDAFTCKICHASFSHLRSLLYHKKNHDRTYKFECPVCAKTFVHKGNLRDHMSIHSPTLVKDQTCEFCNKVFSTKKNLEAHGNVCKFKPGNSKSSFSMFDCRYCSLKFNSVTSIKDHLKIHEMKDGFKCNICDEKFDTAKELENHDYIHSANCPNNLSFNYQNSLTNNNPQEQGSNCLLKCDECNQKFQNKFDLEKHQTIHVAEIKDELTCNHCKKSFNSKRGLSIHMLRCYMNLENRKEFPCNICQKSYLTERGLSSHMLEHNNRILSKVEKNHETVQSINDDTIESVEYIGCGSDISDGNVSEIEETEEPEVISLNDEDDSDDSPLEVLKVVYTDCEMNNQEYFEEKNTIDENSDKQQEFAFYDDDLQNDNFGMLEAEQAPISQIECIYCKKLFKSKSTLNTHSVLCKKLVLERLDFACKLCNKAFMNLNLLDEHENLHNSPNLYKCELCPLKFMTVLKFRKHKQETHNLAVTDSVTSLKCQYCPKTFETMNRLLIHEKWHSNPNMHTCPVCSRQFQSRYTINKHMKTHDTSNQFRKNENSKNFQCDLCDKSFTKESSRKKHQITHEEPTLQCHYCPKKFHCQKNFDAHEVWHTNPDSLKCTVCGKQFESQWGLTLHMRQQHKNSELRAIL